MSTHKSNIFESFGIALKEALLIEGKTPAWLSRETGKDKGQISNYINGKTIPKRITQKELLSPLRSEVVKSEKGWEIIHPDLVSDIQSRYRVRDYKTELEDLEDVFYKIESIRTLLKETEAKLEMTDEQKKIQLEMIRSQLHKILSELFKVD